MDPEPPLAFAWNASAEQLADLPTQTLIDLFNLTSENALKYYAETEFLLTCHARTEMYRNARVMVQLMRRVDVALASALRREEAEKEENRGQKLALFAALMLAIAPVAVPLITRVWRAV